MRLPTQAFGTDAPVDLGRDEAGDAARRELSRGVYRSGLGDRLGDLVSGIRNRLLDLLDRVTGTGHAAPWVGAVVVLAAVAAVAFGLWRVGPPARRRRARDADIAAATPVVDAAGHRAAAARAAAAGDWAGAVRERFRALTRELEQRGVLMPVPGRTAVEIADDAASERPGLRDVLPAAADALGGVVYSSRPAGPADLAAVAAADDAVQALRFGADTVGAGSVGAGSVGAGSVGAGR